MKRIYLWATMAAVMVIGSLVWYGCTKDGDEDLLGTIYGTVTDYATGQPVANANVSLRPGGETALTGSDGIYEFVDVEDGDYSITVSKDGYSDLVDGYVISVKKGKRVRHDVQIKQLFESFIVMVNGQEVNTIDFGTSINSMQITVFNNGTLTIDGINYEESADWFRYRVYTISNLRNIEPNTGRTMNIEIERNKLQSGNNTGYLYLSSGAISKTIIVKAIGN